MIHVDPFNGQLSVFSLQSGSALRNRICQHLGVAPGVHEEREFEDKEHKIRPLKSVRGHDVYIVESLFGVEQLTVNDKLARTLFFVGALRDAGAGRVTAVLPYLCYARKDRRTKPRDPVTTRYVAALFEAVGVNRVVTIDVHNPAAYENAFRIPAELLTAAPIFARTFAPLVGNEPAVVVSPDAGGVKRAERFAAAFQSLLGRDVSLAYVEKFRSEGVVRGGTVVGAVEDATAIIVDDLISSGTTLARAAAACRERGARAVHAAATHGVFSSDASGVIRDSTLDSLVILDTIPPHRVDPRLLGNRVQVIDCAPLLGKAIGSLHANGSLVELDER